MENIVNKILYSKGDKTVPDYTKEIERRRTFAIISHPDAGKTTLTEKFLLYGGAINLAGSVKGKATARQDRLKAVLRPSQLPSRSSLQIRPRVRSL